MGTFISLIMANKFLLVIFILVMLCSIICRASIYTEWNLGAITAIIPAYNDYALYANIDVFVARIIAGLSGTVVLLLMFAMATELSALSAFITLIMLLQMVARFLYGNKILRSMQADSLQLQLLYALLHPIFWIVVRVKSYPFYA